MAVEATVRLAINAHEAPRVTRAHAHAEGQLFSLSAGLLIIEAPAGRWVQPPGWIGWFAPGCTHAAQSFGATAGWSLYLDPALTAALPTHPQVFAATPLVRELVDRLLSLADEPERRLRLVAVLVDELAAGPQPPLHLPMPQERRLAEMAAGLVRDPAQPDDLSGWAARIGMARRTLTRRFAAETGLSFAQWRLQARLLRAVELLSLGESVTAVALTVGYSSVSAFIEAFRRHFGCTPARFFAAGQKKTGEKKPAA